MSSPRVAVVGSGLTGLLIAQGLRKNGIQATVYERDYSLNQHPRDWTLMLHWGLAALHELVPEEVIDTLPHAFCDPFYPHEYPPALPCFNASTGKVLFCIPTTKMRLVSRNRFRQVVAQGLDIEFNKKLARITKEGSDPVTLVFQDGSMHGADIVIGADGPSSAVRACLLGAEKAAAKKTPWVISMSTFTYDDAAKAEYVRYPHPVWHMGYGPDGITGLAASNVQNPEIPSKWEFSYMKLWHDNIQRPVQGEEALKKFKQVHKNFCEPYRSAAEWIPQGSQCDINQLKYWVPEPWNSTDGRITLAGDAAHAVLPFRAQGLNVSLEDAQKLVKCLVSIKNGASRVQIMHMYDKDVYERGREAVLASLEEGKKKMNVELLMSSKTVTQGFAREEAKI